jgi:hypothetical protein
MAAFDGLDLAFEIVAGKEVVQIKGPDGYFHGHHLHTERGLGGIPKAAARRQRRK